MRFRRRCKLVTLGDLCEMIQTSGWGEFKSPLQYQRLDAIFQMVQFIQLGGLCKEFQWYIVGELLVLFQLSLMGEYRLMFQ